MQWAVCAVTQNFLKLQTICFFTPVVQGEPGISS